MKDLIVSEVSAASPEMSKAQFAELVEDIRLHGQLLPIWVQGGEIIDGRKRSRACAELGIEPKTIDIAADTSAGEIAYALNALRTHYSSSQLNAFASKLANYSTKAPKSQMANLGHLKTVREISRATGATPTGMKIAAAVRRDGAPEVIEAVEHGDLSLNAASKIVHLVPQQKHLAALKAAMEPKEKKPRLPRAEARIQKQNLVVDNILHSIESSIGHERDLTYELGLAHWMAKDDPRLCPDYLKWFKRLAKIQRSLAVIASRKKRKIK